MEKRRFTDEEVGKLVRLVELGLSKDQIAEQLGSTEKSVANKLQRIRSFMNPVVKHQPKVLPPETKEWWQFWK